MPDTVAALFDDETQAEFAVHALRSARFASARTQRRRPPQTQMPDIGAHAARGLEIGYLGGTVAGVVLGVVAAGLIPRTHVFITSRISPSSAQRQASGRIEREP